MAQNTLLLRYLRLRFGFWPQATNFLGYHLKNVKFPILTKKTKVFRYLGFILGFSPQTPNFLGFHLKIFKFPILTRKPWQYSNIYILNSLLHPILYPKCVPHLGYKFFVPNLEYIYFTKNEVEQIIFMLFSINSVPKISAQFVPHLGHMRHVVFVPHLPCLALMLQHNSQVLPWHLYCNNAMAFAMAPWHLCYNNAMAFAMSLVL